MERFGRIREGMTDQEVRRILGYPARLRHLGSQVALGKYREPGWTV
jgi:hypothetical protein